MAHYSAYLGTVFGGITMNVAIAAKGFVLHKRAKVNPLKRISKQLLAQGAGLLAR